MGVRASAALILLFIVVLSPSTTVGASPPELVLSPRFGEPGSRCVFFGSGFDPERNVTLMLYTWGDSYVCNLIHGFWPEPSGAFSGSFTVPAAISGNYLVKAVQEETGLVAVCVFKIGTVIVLLPVENGPIGASIRFSGSGFTPGGGWNASFDGTQFASGIAPPSSIISGSFIVPSTTTPRHVVRFSDLTTMITLEVPFNVTSLWVNSDAYPDDNVTVVGAYFTVDHGLQPPDGTTVEFVLSNSTYSTHIRVRQYAGQPQARDVLADGAGNFTGWWLVSESGLSSGFYTVNATDANGLWASAGIRIWGAPGDWSTVQQNPSRTGYSSSIAPENCHLEWYFNFTEYDTPSLVCYPFGDPVVYGGRLYVSASNTLFCLNSTTGEVLWESPGWPANNYMFDVSPSAAEGKVYTIAGYGNGTNCVLCFDALDGSLIWRFSGDGGESILTVFDQSVAVSYGRVYFGAILNSNVRGLYCLNATTGDALWFFSYCVNPGSIWLPEYETVYGTPAVESGRVYFYSSWESGWSLNCVDAFDKDLLWRKFMTWHGYNMPSSTPVVSDGRVYITDSYSLHCCNAYNGYEYWMRDDLASITIPSVAYGRVFVGCNLYYTESNSVYHALLCLNQTNGDEIWRYRSSSTSVFGFSSLSTADGKLYVSCGWGILQCHNASTGELLWGFRTEGDWLESSPTIANGFVYVSSEDRNLYAFSTEGQPGDFNGNGITDGVDEWPIRNWSSTFNDYWYNGTTYGNILDYGDQAPSIVDLPYPLGVSLEADSSGGVAPAVIVVSGYPTYLNVSLSAGDRTVATRRQVISYSRDVFELESQRGFVNVNFRVPQGKTVWLNLTEGCGALIDFSRGVVAAHDSNTGDIIVTIDLDTHVLHPGNIVSFAYILILNGVQGPSVGVDWSLIGVPGRLVDPRIEAVFGAELEHIKAIYGYVDGEWRFWIPGVSSTLATLESGCGYWVLSDAEYDLAISTYPADEPQLRSGWNLIGIAGESSQNVDDYLDGLGWSAVFGFDSSIQSWSYNISGLGGTLTTLRPGGGYWVLVK